ncbi:stage III sporulation protein AB [Caloranaerobacter sp. TR13]|uniref:stage III sporulation protein SpoIIIAB n=1 Tax=Caloranaerobacter sp. TR13 TaxID=1302151 RepID=UPI0006D3BB96|nr:stage III sporulation protein SpoIIIAB [Caloranaerobacter sp. TR13]KPU28081.1 stage III sporulation protein AB [Caloranaerobacter sp. TR13]
MFVIRLITSITIVLSCTFIGYYLANKYNKRYVNLVKLQSCIQLLETEIVYCSTPLPEALENVYNKCDKSVSFVFKDLKDLLIANRNLNVYEAFSQQIENLSKRLYLDFQDIETLMSLGRVLGISDTDDQQKHFKLVLMQLKNCQKDAELKKQVNEKLFKNLGILTGLAIVILLF